MPLDPCLRLLQFHGSLSWIARFPFRIYEWCVATEIFKFVNRSAETHGSGILTHAFHTFEPYKGAMDKKERGALISYA